MATVWTRKAMNIKEIIQPVDTRTDAEHLQYSINTAVNVIFSQKSMNHFYRTLMGGAHTAALIYSFDPTRSPKIGKHRLINMLHPSDEFAKVHQTNGIEPLLTRLRKQMKGLKVFYTNEPNADDQLRCFIWLSADHLVESQ